MFLEIEDFMKSLKLMPLVMILMMALSLVSQASAQDFSFSTIDNNNGDIEKKSRFTGASFAADFDGENVNNDVALIDQGRGIVFVLIYNQKETSPARIIPLVLSDIVGEQYVPTSATAFLDTQTGKQNIAITAIASPITDDSKNGKIIVGINGGTGSFELSGLQVFSTSSGPTDINHGDFNFDGFDDLVFVDFRNNRATVLLNDGNNLFERQESAPTGGVEPVSAVVGDFNDDDYLDLVVLNKEKDPVNRSNVRVMLGDGKGGLILKETAFLIQNFGISMAGGLVDINTLAISEGRPVRRNLDLNVDGLPDVAVLSMNGSDPEAGAPALTLLLNDPNQPGRLLVQPSVEVSSLTGNSKLALDSKSGPGLVSGSGSGPVPIGVGGGYHALAASDFNQDESPDLVVGGSIIASAMSPAAGVSFRAAAFLTGNNLASAVRLPAPIDFGYVKGAVGKNDMSALDPSEGGDTFVASIPGAFAQLLNRVPGVLHVSLNGNIWLSRNITSIFDHGTIVTIRRKDLNAPFPGGGRKVILTAGQKARIPISTFDIDNEIGFRFNFVTIKNQATPSFASIENNNGTGPATIVIDTSNLNLTDSIATFSIGVSSNPICPNACGRFSISGIDSFTLVVMPNSPPIIRALPDQNIIVGRPVTIELSISDKENQRVNASVKCDRGDFVKLNGTTLTIAPQEIDIGTNRCTITAIDEPGISSSISFAVTVKGLPTIVSAALIDSRLTIRGSGFDSGANAAVVSVNGKDVSAMIIKESDSRIILKGNRKKLNLNKGPNQLIVKSGDLISNTFVLNLGLRQ
jgi:hypothetical protein